MKVISYFEFSYEFCKKLICVSKYLAKSEANVLNNEYLESVIYKLPFRNKMAGAENLLKCGFRRDYGFIFSGKRKHRKLLHCYVHA